MISNSANKQINRASFLFAIIAFLVLFLGNNSVSAKVHYPIDEDGVIACCNSYINEKGCTLGNLRCIDPAEYGASTCSWYPIPKPVAYLYGRVVTKLISFDNSIFDSFYV